MVKWRECLLGDVVNLTMGFPFKSAAYIDDIEGLKLLRGDNIAQGRLRWEGVKRWPVSSLEQYNQYQMRPGDIVLAMDRPWIEAGLKYAAVSRFDCPSLLVQRVARLRETEHIVANFLRYVIGSPSFTDYVLGVQTGTAVPHISGGQIKSYRLRLPDKVTQQTIANVLSSLDDKIELNRRMNATLEGVTQAIFRDWFVDFGPVRRKLAGASDAVAILGGIILDPVQAAPLAAVFPATLPDGSLPAGWSTAPLDEIADFLNGLALQKFPARLGEPSLPVIKIADLRNGVTSRSDRASRHLPSKYIIDDGDYIFSWSGSLMAKVWSEGEGALNQHLFKVTSERFPQWFYASWVQHHMAEFQMIAASKATTMGHIQRGHLKAAMTVCPDSEGLAAMDRLIRPLWEKMLSNDLENRRLAETRDYLLPRLMSGKVSVTNIQRVAG